jgi:hypothetical protein
MAVPLPSDASACPIRLSLTYIIDNQPIILYYGQLLAAAQQLTNLL